MDIIYSVIMIYIPNFIFQNEDLIQYIYLNIHLSQTKYELSAEKSINVIPLYTFPSSFSFDKK